MLVDGTLEQPQGRDGPRLVAQLKHRPHCVDEGLRIQAPVFVEAGQHLQGKPDHVFGWLTQQVQISPLALRQLISRGRQLGVRLVQCGEGGAYSLLSAVLIMHPNGALTTGTVDRFGAWYTITTPGNVHRYPRPLR